MPDHKTARRLQIEAMKIGAYICVEDKKQDQNIITAIGTKNRLYCIVDGCIIRRVK